MEPLFAPPAQVPTWGTLRHAVWADRFLLWEWLHDPLVRQMSLTHEPPAWEAHCAWVEEHLHDPHCRLYIADSGDVPIGQVRFDLSEGVARTTVSVAEGWRGGGLGTSLLRAACDQLRTEFPLARIEAEIMPENTASKRAFTKAGFKHKGTRSVQGMEAEHWELQRYVVGAATPWARKAAHEMAGMPGAWYLARGRSDIGHTTITALNPHRLFFLHWHWAVEPWLVNGYECIGFHIGDLPRGRGGSPVQNLILQGVQETAVCAFRMTDEMDAGPLYGKRPLSLTGRRAETIYEQAMMCCLAMARAIIQYGEVRLTPQEGEPTFFKRRSPEQSVLPLEGGVDASGLYDFIRMLDAEGYPHAFIEYGDWRLEFRGAELANETVTARVEITRRPGGAS